MSIFSMSDQKDKKEADTRVGLDQSIRDLLSCYVGIARLHQYALSQQVKIDKWNVDLTKGLIYFNNQPYPIQLMGTESLKSSSWLWAFGNPSNFPKELLDACTDTYNHLNKDAFSEVSPITLPLSQHINGYTLSSIGAALQPRCCYYRCPYDAETALFVLVEDLPKELFSSPPPFQILSILKELIEYYQLNHLLLVENTFEEFALSMTCGDKVIQGLFSNGQSIKCEFDALDRISSFELF